MVSQTGTGNEPVVVLSDAPETVDGRQAIALQSVTMMTINPVNVSEGESTTNTFGVSPNTNPTEITQPLIATEDAADTEPTGLVVLEPSVRFYVEYQSITERERRKCLRVCSFETPIDELFKYLPNGRAVFRPSWKRSLMDKLISVIARNIPSGSGREVAEPFNLACSNLRSDSFARRLRFSLYGYDDDPSSGSVLLDWLEELAGAINPEPMFVAIIIDQPDLISLLRADDVIPFVAEDGVAAEYEEVAGDGSFQAFVQQHEAEHDAAIKSVMKDTDEPGFSSDAPELDEDDDPDDSPPAC